MSYGSMIREWRDKKGWIQQQLAEKLGCTGGYIALLESEKRVPSAEICIALATVFELTPEEKQKLFEVVRNVRRQLAEERNGIRDGFRASQTQGGTMTPKRTTGNIDAESIASDLASDNDLKTAYLDLKTALANPQQRDATLNVIRALAEQAARQV